MPSVITPPQSAKRSPLALTNLPSLDEELTECPNKDPTTPSSTSDQAGRPPAQQLADTFQLFSMFDVPSKQIPSNESPSLLRACHVDHPHKTSTREVAPLSISSAADDDESEMVLGGRPDLDMSQQLSTIRAYRREKLAQAADGYSKASISTRPQQRRFLDGLISEVFRFHDTSSANCTSTPRHRRALKLVASEAREILKSDPVTESEQAHSYAKSLQMFASARPWQLPTVED